MRVIFVVYIVIRGVLDIFNIPIFFFRDWIEAATREKFPSPDFATSTKNGVLLCKLLNQISPNIVPKINQQKNAVAERENISFFLAGCKKLGLRETQLFTTNDLYEGNYI